jgi:putative ABC transport system ATP-binding protein
MLGGVRRSTAVARAAAWFPALGLDGLEQRRPGQLSSGQ